MESKAGPGAPASATLLPLDGIRVLELGWRVGISACGALLAQLGAEVMVIEPHQTSTDGKWRHRAASMAGKHSVVLCGDAAEDHALISKVAPRVDVILSSGDWSGSHSAWELPVSAGTIACDITAFGHSGPLAGLSGTCETVEALSGVLDTNGLSDCPPIPCGTEVLEFSAALFACSSILAALHLREKEGIGQRIDIALYDTAINALVNFIPLHMTGQAVTRSGNRHPLHTPWGCYSAKDGHVLICSVTAQQFQRICEAIGDPRLAQDERFCTSSARLVNYQIIDAKIQTWVGRLSRADCVGALSRHGIACGPVVEVSQLPSEPNLQFRGAILKVYDALSGKVVELPMPPLFSADLALRTPRTIPAPDEGRLLLESWLSDKNASRAQPTEGARANSLPLEGYRIVEIGQYTVAPLVSRHLGSFGADVIKIESPDGDAIRTSAPLRPDGRSFIFALSNTDKRGLVLDLRRADHQEALHQLLGKSDALVENLKPGSLAKLGFSTEILRQRHPHLVYCSVNGFGLHSAYPGRPALDTVVQAMSGLMDLMRINGQPLKTGISSSDTLGGQVGLVAVLSGLLQRSRHGQAPHFDISMQDATSWVTQMEWPGGHPRAGITVLAAKDGHVCVHAPQAQVDSLLPELVGLTRGQVVGFLQSRAIPATAILGVGEVLESAQVQERELLLQRPSCDEANWLVLGSPMRLERSPPQVRSAMGALGIEDAALIQEFSLGIQPITLQDSRERGHA
jgi:crotonobetainyl-CoA:carnitine CoA-transferase CaiB-like acyl-CoA transferase